MKRFLEEYRRADSYLDWGDDPSFFSAITQFGDPRRATWGVCRRDVRGSLVLGDAVAFICAKFLPDARRREYHYVGCGTVGNLINDRRLIWKDEGYTLMRDYLNILAQPDTRGRLRNIEVFPEHKDWQRRAEQPYVLFDPDRTAFNLTNPHLVAMFEPSNGVSERWCTDTVSSELRRLFFTRTRQHLKTSLHRNQHPKLRIHCEPHRLADVRDRLVEMA